jgi:hypothetical protein
VPERKRQHLVRADFEIALQLATELDFLFDKGNYDEKRLLCETVFKRVHLKAGKITRTELKAPFALITRCASGSGAVTNGGGLNFPNYNTAEIITYNIYNYDITTPS